MNEYDWTNELVLEEWAAAALESVGPAYNTLSLRNSSGKDIDELTLADEFGRVAGINRIKSLVIEPSSKLRNLAILKSFPALETLQLNGLHLRTLNGLEWFKHGRFLKIDTGKNRKRSIAKIAETPIARLSLHWANSEDLEAIGQSRTVRELLLSNCPKLSLERWRDVPIETMSLFGGRLVELTDTASVGTLSKLTLFDCRNLERFRGNNDKVTWMVVQHCNRLDWPTIASYKGLEHLAVVGVKHELPLSAFAGLYRLKSLSLQQCKVRIDITDLKLSAPQLEQFMIIGPKEAQLAELSNTNRDVVVSNGVVSYKNGERHSGESEEY
jgi:hypothetical protein